MPRRSTIERLPAEVRELIGKLRDGGRTIDEILAKLQELDVDVARSTLGRHIKSLDQIAERIRRSRDVADALVRRVGEAGENKQLRLNVELMHSIIMDIFSGGEDGQPISLGPEDAMFLARSLRDLANASKTDTEHVLKIREAAEREAKAAAVKAVEKVAREAGLSAETLQRCRAEILGIKPPVLDLKPDPEPQP